jgi:drug/metabolite transporter (DMT)-like permease
MPNRGSFKIIIGSILFGLIPLFVRFGADLSIASIALGRAIFASIFARFYLYFSKEKVSFKIDLIRTKTFFHFLNWTFFLTLAIVFYFLSIQSGSIALAGVLMGAHPIFVVLFVYLFFKERIRKKTLISCLLSIIGIVLISGFTSDQSSTTFLSSMYALGSAFFLGLNFTYYLKYLKGFSAGKLVFYQNVLQIPLLIPFALINPGTFSPTGIISMICLGVLCTGIAYFLVYSGSQSVKNNTLGFYK